MRVFIRHSLVTVLFRIRVPKEDIDPANKPSILLSSIVASWHRGTPQ
jgi:hypothetical protein